MSDKDRAAGPGRESAPRGGAKAGTVEVSCGMEGCDATGLIRFLGDAPFEGFKFDTANWTVVEDAEDHRTVFLCADCAKEFEEQAGAEGEEEDDDEEDEDEDEMDDDEPAPPRGRA